MPGPTTAAEALQWVQEAIAAARFIIDSHFWRRAGERSLDNHDAKHIIANATLCEP